MIMASLRGHALLRLSRARRTEGELVDDVAMGVTNTYWLSPGCLTFRFQRCLSFSDASRFGYEVVTWRIPDALRWLFGLVTSLTASHRRPFMRFPARRAIPSGDGAVTKTQRVALALVNAKVTLCPPNPKELLRAARSPSTLR